MFSRRAVAPGVLGGRTAAVGRWCLVSPVLLQRDPRWWTELERFLPGSWLQRGPGSATPSRWVASGACCPRCADGARAIIDDVTAELSPLGDDVASTHEIAAGPVKKSHTWLIMGLDCTAIVDGRLEDGSARGMRPSGC